MKLLNTIRALFRSRRAAGGEVRPGRPSDDDTRLESSPGGPVGTYEVVGGPFDGQTRTDVHVDSDGIYWEYQDVQRGFVLQREAVIHKRVLTRDGRLLLKYVETREPYASEDGHLRYRRAER